MADMINVLDALPGFPNLRGPRVRLRGPRAEDAEAVFAVFSEPAVMRYWSSTPMQALAQAEGRIAEMLEGFAQRQMLPWVIVDPDDAVIGTCTLFHFDGKHRRGEIGYALRPDRWGQGHGAGATALAIDWAFRTLGLHRLEADIDPRNEASRRLLLRHGFVSEGRLRERFFLAGEPTDSEILGLLASDWSGRSPAGKGLL